MRQEKSSYWHPLDGIGDWRPALRIFAAAILAPAAVALASFGGFLLGFALGYAGRDPMQGDASRVALERCEHELLDAHERIRRSRMTIGEVLSGARPDEGAR